MQDDRHIATLLGFSGTKKDKDDLLETQKDVGDRHNSKLTDVLLKTLLRNLSFHVVCNITSVYIIYFIQCRYNLTH